MSDRKPEIEVKKSFRDAGVALRINLRARDYAGPSLTLTASTDLTIEEARTLANDLLAHADQAEAKQQKKEAREERRRAWRDREVAAGRMKVLTLW